MLQGIFADDEVVFFFALVLLFLELPKTLGTSTSTGMVGVEMRTFKTANAEPFCRGKKDTSHETSQLHLNSQHTEPESDSSIYKSRLATHAWLWLEHTSMAAGLMRELLDFCTLLQRRFEMRLAFALLPPTPCLPPDHVPENIEKTSSVCSYSFRAWGFRISSD